MWTGVSQLFLNDILKRIGWVLTYAGISTTFTMILILIRVDLKQRSRSEKMTEIVTKIIKNVY